MLNRIINLFIGDINIILHNKKLLARCLAPFIFILLLKYVLPPFSDLIFSKTGFHLARYYAVIAITLVSIIPMLIGSVSALILLHEKELHPGQSATAFPDSRNKSLFVRVAVSVFISFIYIIITLIVS